MGRIQGERITGKGGSVNQPHVVVALLQRQVKARSPRKHNVMHLVIAAGQSQCAGAPTRGIDGNQLQRIFTAVGIQRQKSDVSTAGK
ncbi:hypothetical protein D3C80_977560 [compost metagenome]